MKLGYACAWWHPREPTWSYSATRLRTALEAHAGVVDIEAQRSLPGKAMLLGLSKLQPGTPWQYSKIERRLMDRAVRRGVQRLGVDVVLGIGDVDTPTTVPTFLYQDINIALDTRLIAEHGPQASNMLPSSPEVRTRLGTERLERARSATGIFAMSRWYADFLVSEGVDADRIVVTPAGMNNPPTAVRDPAKEPTGRVLFVGRDFHRKGADLVVDAVRLLRDGGVDARLTVVGPEHWPQPGAIPEFVDFRGPLGAADVAAIYARHDIFAMPSRVEGFGIVFAEALAAGLPCVARRAFAMPELVEDGVTGALIDDDDPEALAAAIGCVLADRDVYRRVATRRDEIRHRHDWSTAAANMVAAMRQLAPLH
jgi:glycosyltransferase involved in cell wall biosynthesis